MEDDVLRDMIFEMNGMRVYHVNYPLVEESKKRKRERENVNYYCLRGTLLYRAGPFLRTISEPLIMKSRKLEAESRA